MTNSSKKEGRKKKIQYWSTSEKAIPPIFLLIDILLYFDALI